MLTMIRVRVAVMLLGVLSTQYWVLGTVWSAAPNAPAARDFTTASWHMKLVELHNAARAELKAAPLVANAQLAQAAQQHADHMATTGKFAHAEIGDGDPTTRIDATGYKGRKWGENIAWGAPSAEQAHKIWMESPPHREQLLTPEYKEVGFGACKAADGKIYWVACFGAPP
jgi:uncharacterized protein YkwD